MNENEIRLNFEEWAENKLFDLSCDFSCQHDCGSYYIDHETRKAYEAWCSAIKSLNKENETSNELYESDNYRYHIIVALMGALEETQKGDNEIDILFGNLHIILDLKEERFSING